LLSSPRQQEQVHIPSRLTGISAIIISSVLPVEAVVVVAQELAELVPVGMVAAAVPLLLHLM
jgi:hypothetical protein